MNDKTVELLQENLPRVAEALKTTAEVAYDKVTWYIRISGWIELSGWVLAVIASVIWIKITANFVKKEDVGSDAPGIYLISFLIFVFLLVVGSLMFMGLSDSVIKIISPDYYIIKQVITKLAQ